MASPVSDKGELNIPLPNKHLVDAIISSVPAISEGNERTFQVSAIHSTADPRTELDSHANMVVLGKHSFVFEATGKTCNVQGFSSELGQARNVPIVDGAIAYDCPITGQVYILLVRNALHIPTMEVNLIPPFIMRAGGVIINDVPKSQCDNPTVSHHCISFKQCELKIPLQLNGIFSFFHHRVPTPSELEGCDKVFITPDSDSWNPHCESFARNEQSMMDFDGNIAASHRQTRYVMEPENIDEPYELSSVTVDAWGSHIDQVIADSHCVDVLANDHPTNECSDLAHAAALRGEISKMAASLGSLNLQDSNHSDDLFLKDNAIFTTLDDQELQFTKEMNISSTLADRPKGVSAKALSKLWYIREDLAQGAIDSTTQLKRHNADNTLSRNFSTNDRMLRYRRIQSWFYTDTMFATRRGKSTRQNTCCQVFVSDKGFVAVYPMRHQRDFQDALHLFCKEIGVPTTLVADSHPSQTSKEVRRFCDQVGTTLRQLEKSTQWANRAELYIGLLKEAVRKDMRQSNAPMVLWDFCIQRRARIHNVTPRPLFQNDGLNPHSATFGNQADISNLCCFGWYEWVYYRDHGTFPINKEKLGKALGPIKNEGNEMAQAILAHTGSVVPRRTVRRLRRDEITSPIELEKQKAFNDAIKSRLGDAAKFPTRPIPDTFVGYDEDPLEFEDPVHDDGTAKLEAPITDHLIHAEVHMPQGEDIKPAKVLRRSKDIDGNPIGAYNDHPLLNTIKYDVEFPDGEVKEYCANLIAENMFSQVDANGQVHTLLDAITDYTKDSTAVAKADGYLVTRSGRRRRRHTTSGWSLNILWKDGKTQWIPLSLMKESHPIETAEFAISRGIEDEPAFAWWVPFVVRKRDKIIASLSTRATHYRHKYSVEIPSTIDQAYDLDRSNGNTLWRDALNKEMSNLQVAFDILPQGHKPPPGYRKASGHIIFDVRMTLERKARWVKDGHKTPAPDNCTFAGVVSRESVRIAMTVAALNNLNICACDIQNAYLQAPSSEKHYIICGPEFGLENVGCVGVIVRALYGGKSAGADYWRHVRSAMSSMKFTSCAADPDVWMRPGTKSDGTAYWQYVLLYTDDILAIMESPEQFLRTELGSYFTIKEKSIGPPTQYLGNKVSQVTMSNDQKCWSFSSSQYVQSAVSNVEAYATKHNLKFPARCKSPWTSQYRPECDTTAELNPSRAAYYQSLIGVLRWIVELGRVDICMEVSALASMMASPREGHLLQLFHMFGYLKTNHNGVMVFDPSEPTLDLNAFPQEDWSASVYGSISEVLPANMPEARGAPMTMRAFVDSDHAGDISTRRSRTGYAIFLNSSPIYWFSKKQTGVETSSFGSEFMAMKLACEYVRGMRFKLRMMGISLPDPTYIFGDNQSVLANTSRPHSVLRKKSSSIAYHFVREGVARDEWRTTYLNTNHNPSDILTKSLPGGEKRSRFTSFFLHYLD